MDTHIENQVDGELLSKLKTVFGRALAELNAAEGSDVQLHQFVTALDTESRTINRLLAAVVKETIAPRRLSPSASPTMSMRGSSVHGSYHAGYSPAIDASIGIPRRNRLPSAGVGTSGVDLDHVRSLMEAIEIVSPHMVGADLTGCGSPIPDSRSGWSLPGQAAHSLSEQHGLPGSFGAAVTSATAAVDVHTHAARNRRTSAQAAHGAGIPIRPSRPRGRGGHIDPAEFAEYAVAHMRPSPRFTPMGHAFPLGSAMASEPRSSLPRSLRTAHLGQHMPDAGRHPPPVHLPRQHALDEMRLASSAAHSARPERRSPHQEGLPPDGNECTSQPLHIMLM
ncbi:hypothetical protein GGI24_002536 [Coemansia furcata]|nr:hypothetical protein GGI24_002536 [Coemansia furcata]